MFSERVRERLKAIGYGQNELARKIGVSSSTMSRIINDDGSTAFTAKMVENLANALGVSYEWLATGKGSPQPSAEDDGYMRGVRESEAKYGTSDSAVLIPMYNVRASAGSGTGLFEPIDRPDSFMRLSVSFLKEISGYSYQRNDALTILTQQGDSMAPTVRPGDLMLCLYAQEFTGDGVYVFELDDDIMVKRLQRTSKGFNVISDNDKYPPWALDDINHIRLRARVIFALKGEAL